MLHHIGLGAGRPGIEWLCLATWLLVPSISAALDPGFDSNPWGSGTRLGIMAALAFVPAMRLSTYRAAKRVTEAPLTSTPISGAGAPSWAERLVAEAESDGWRVMEITKTPRIGRAVEMTREGSDNQLSIARVPRGPFTFFLRTPVAVIASVTADRSGLVLTANLGIHLVDHPRCLSQWDRSASLTDLLTGHGRLLQSLRATGVGVATFTSVEAHERAYNGAIRSLSADPGWRTRAATGVDRALTSRRDEPSAADIAEFAHDTKATPHLPPLPLGSVGDPRAGSAPPPPPPPTPRDTAGWHGPS
jgi:hypothetical protein